MNTLHEAHGTPARSPKTETLPLPRFLQLFEALSRCAILCLFALYCLGFVVTNLHLARFGYFSLGIFERRYAFAGFWALTPPLLFWSTERFYMHGMELSKHRDLKRIRKPLRVAGGFLLYLLLYWTLQSSTTALLGVRLPWLKWWGVGLVGVIATQLFSRTAYRALRERITPRGTLTSNSHGKVPQRQSSMLEVLRMVNWGWSPLLVTYLSLFTYAVFPDVPARWGGGGTESVRLVLSTDDAAALSALGLPMDGAATTASVALVATTSDDYVVLVDSSKTVYVRRDLIHAVAVTGKFRLPASRAVGGRARASAGTGISAWRFW